jgi:hypothetical protein
VPGYLSKESVKAGTFQPMLPNFRMSIVCRNVHSIRPFVVWYEPRVADKHAPLVEKKAREEKSLPLALLARQIYGAPVVTGWLATDRLSHDMT